MLNYKKETGSVIFYFYK